MTNLGHNQFKKMYYVFAFVILFFVSTILGYLLFNTFVAKDSRLSTVTNEDELTTTEVDESKSSETLLDQEVEETQDVLNSSDYSTLENEDLSGLE